jgi:hypothetical protein
MSNPTSTLDAAAVPLWRHIFGEHHGYLAVFSGVRRPDVRELQDTCSRYFVYPTEVDAAAAYVLAETTAGREVYECGHLLTATRRVKENASQMWAAYVDGDGAAVPDGIPPPSLIVESSPGRQQYFCGFTTPVSPTVGEQINRRLAYALGADKSGWDLTQLLRVPGTYNRKYDPAPQVTISYRNDRLAYDPAELAERLPPLPVVEKATHRESEPGAPPVRLEGTALERWRGERVSTREGGALDRSDSLFYLGIGLAEAGASGATITAALRERDLALGWRKYCDRLDAAERYSEIADKAIEYATAPTFEVPGSNGAAHKQAAQTARATATAEPRRNGQMPDLEALKLYSARDLLALDIPAIRWAVPDTIPEGLTLVVGKPKIGKSWLVLGLAVGVSLGGAVLGQIPVEAGDVLYLALEDGKRRLKTRLTAVLGGEAAPTGLTLATEWPRFDQGGLGLIEAWLDMHPDARLIIVDTLVRVRGRTTRQTQLYEQDYDALAGLHRLATERRVAVLVVHHSRKMSGEDVLDEVSGTTGITAVADSVLVLKRERGQADASLFLTGRDLEQERELALKWDPVISGWNIIGDAAEYRQSAERKAIKELVTQYPEGVTPSEAAPALGKTVNAAKFLMWKMGQDGELRNLGGGRYATANPANRLTEGTENGASTRETRIAPVSGRAPVLLTPLTGEQSSRLAPVSSGVAATNRPLTEDASAGAGSAVPVSTVSAVSGGVDNPNLKPCPGDGCGKMIPLMWQGCAVHESDYRDRLPAQREAP